MTLRTITIVGWICFALDTVFVLGLLVSKNMGDDAAGRGLATAWGTILAVPLLIAGALLVWGTRGSRGGAIAGALLAGLPFIILATNAAKGFGKGAVGAVWRSREGKFDDPVITEMAKAVDRADTAAMTALLAKGPRDFSQRDAWNQTILGYAVKYAGGTYGDDPRRKAIVRVMVVRGVPYASNATPEDYDWFAGIASSAGDHMNEVLEAALKAGADPDAKAPFDDFPIIFSANMTPAKVEMLAKHGADLQARSWDWSRKGWSALMNAVYQQQWTEALFFLRHGVSPDYRAEDGKTVHDVMEDVVTGGWTNVDSTDAAYRELRTALGAKR